MAQVCGCWSWEGMGQLAGSCLCWTSCSSSLRPRRSPGTGHCHLSPSFPSALVGFQLHLSPLMWPLSSVAIVFHIVPPMSPAILQHGDGESKDLFCRGPLYRALMFSHLKQGQGLTGCGRWTGCLLLQSLCHGTLCFNVQCMQDRCAKKAQPCRQ